MSRALGSTAVIVGDFDEAVEYYTKKLGFKLKEDLMIDQGTRIVLIAQSDHEDATITLVKKDDSHKFGKLGHYAGRNTLRILETQDIRSTYAIFKARGVNFTGEPTEVPYGMEVSFEDPYGNEFDLVEVRY